MRISWLQKVLRDGDEGRRDIGAEHDICLRSTQAFRTQLDFAESKLLAVTLGGSNLTQDRKFKMKMSTNVTALSVPAELKTQGNTE